MENPENPDNWIESCNPFKNCNMFYFNIARRELEITTIYKVFISDWSNYKML